MTPCATARSWFAGSIGRLARFMTGRRAELVLACLILAAATAVRVVKLDTLPRILAGDELDNLQTAYHIIEGTGPGPFGFDWKPAPALGLYPLAWSVRIFGNGVWSFRMFPVVMGVLTLALFYPLARQSMRPFAAVASLALLGSNLWFLHFSRTAWDNINSALFAVGACLCASRAIDSRGWRWWAGAGAFSALGMYGYFTGRFIIVAVLVQVALAVALRTLSWRDAVRGGALVTLIAAVLVAPLAVNVLEDWDYFNRRTQMVSVFNTKQPYEGDTNGWVIAAKNVVRNYRGFVLQDGSEFRRGLWTRYGPPGAPPLDLLTTHLFWVGMVVAVVRFRQSFHWWPYFIPLFISEVFSRGTPDLARGVLFAPFYFLYVGLGVDALGQVVETWGRRATATAAAILAIGVVAAGAWNIREYFLWQSRDAVQMQRLPGIDRCEWELWRDMAREAARLGNGGVNGAEFEARRRVLDCSPVVRATWTR
ncbi:MAG TPA: glycosyltransferase family 39 protein [Dehalococcoidia bacterium]|nr:glycosyltransferase family 39 protein [Dehalococcoidia bacterium]